MKCETENLREPIMNTAIIPYQPSALTLPDANAAFQMDCFKAKRKGVLDELRCLSTIPSIAGSLQRETLYKLVCAPEGAEMLKDSAGNIKGVFYKDGKIVEHAKFKAVKPSMVKAAAAVGSQVLLISIAMQLNKLEGEIGKLRRELHNDRLAEIEAGIQQYRYAMLVEDATFRHQQIANAIQSLGKGLQSTMRALTMQIDEMPSAKVGFFDNWGKSKNQIAAEKFSLVQESFQVSLMGMQTMSECYAAIDEPRAAAKALQENLTKLKACGIEKVMHKARLIEFKDDALPEAPLKSFLEAEPRMLEQVSACSQLADEQFARIEIELKPEELMEV